MKIAKLIIGIVTICLSMFIIFQSCAASCVDALASTGGSSGTAGFFVAIMIIAAGIVMIVTSRKGSRGGSIACLILYVIAAIIGFSCAGIYSDLYIWSGMCVALAVFSIFGIIFEKRK